MPPIYNYPAMLFAVENGAQVTGLSLPFDGNHSFSLGFWLRPMTLGDIGLFFASVPSGFSVESAGGYVTVHWGTTNALTTQWPLVLNAWQYVLITFASNGNGGGTIAVYFSGALAGTSTMSGLGAGAITATSILLGNGTYAHCLSASVWSTCLLPGSPSFKPQWQAPAPQAGLELSVDFSEVPARDVSGNNRPVQYLSASDIVTCYPGVYFGDTGYVEPDAADGVSPGYGIAPFSLAAWVYPEEVTALADTDMAIVANGDVMATNAFVSFLQFNSANSTLSWCVQRGGAAGTVIVSTATIAPNSWHHLAVTYDGTTLTLYVDGVASGSAASGNVPALATPGLVIGAALDSSEGSGYSHEFEGYMQAVGIWTTCLTAAQVQAAMTTEPTAAAGCVAYYDFRAAPVCNMLTGAPVALFNDAAIDELQVLSSPTVTAASTAPSGAANLSAVRGSSTLLTAAEIDAAVAHYDRLVDLHAPEGLRQHYRDLFRGNLAAGLARAEQAGGVFPGMVTAEVKEGFSVFYHHTADGPLECARFPTATVDPTTAWIIAVIATAFSVLMGILGVGFAGTALVQYLGRWAAAAAGGVNGATMQELRLILAQQVTGETVVKLLRSLYGAGVLGSAIASGLSGIAWYSWAFTIVSIGAQIASLWLTGGWFLLYMLAQIGLSIGQLVTIIGNKPSGANPVPVLNGLNPGGASVGGAAFTLTVFGTRFVTQTTNNVTSLPVVNWNGSPRTTTFVSETKLTAQLTAADIATAGQFSVTVDNPNSSGVSNALLFTVA